MTEPYRQTIEVKDDLAEAGRVQEELHAAWERLELPEEVENPVSVALEEVLTNVIRHGRRPGESKEIRVTFLADGDGFEFAVSDRAAAFDPTTRPDPDVAAPLGERRAGGMGILLVRRLADELQYEWRDGRNHLRFRKRFGAGGERR